LKVQDSTKDKLGTDADEVGTWVFVFKGEELDTVPVLDSRISFEK